MEQQTHGPAYDKVADSKRLNRQMDAIRDYMLMEDFKTLIEIEGSTRFPQASISAQLRHLRKTENGGFEVEKRRRHEGGTWEYRVRPKATSRQPGLFEATAPASTAARYGA